MQNSMNLAEVIVLLSLIIFVVAVLLAAEYYKFIHSPESQHYTWLAPKKERK